MIRADLRLLFMLLIVISPPANADSAREVVSPSEPAAPAVVEKQLQKANCESDMREADCTALAKDPDGEVSKYLRKCENNDADSPSSMDLLKICSSLIVQPLTDTVKGLVLSARNNVQKRRELAKMCEKTPDCKYAIALNLPTYKDMDRVEIEKISAEQLIIEFEYEINKNKMLDTAENLQRQSITAFKTPVPQDFKGPDRVSIPFVDKLACLNTKGRTKAICYGFFSAFDTAAVVLLTKTAPGLFRALTATSKVEKLVAENPAPDVIDTYKPAPSQLDRSPLHPLRGRPIDPVEATLKDISKTGPPVQSGLGSGNVFYVTYKDGTKGIWKPHDGDWNSNYRAEVLAYEVDKKFGFGLVPPTVEATINGEKGSIQLFEPEAQQALDKKFNASAMDLNRQSLFDYIIDNRDRNPKNYLIAPNGRVFSIDNSLSFTGKGFNGRSFAERKKAIQAVLATADGKAIIKKLNAEGTSSSFRSELANYLGDKDADRMINRIKVILDFSNSLPTGQ